MSGDETFEEEEKPTEIDKSFELFKYSNLLKQRTWFKLKCEFTVPSGSSANGSYTIRWFKLSERKNLTVLHEFDSLSERTRPPDEQMNAVIDTPANTDFSSSNVFVSELETRELESVHRTASVGALSKLRSTLVFLFKNVNDLDQAAGLYLCKPEFVHNGPASFASSNVLNHLQTIQRVSVNGN